MILTHLLGREEVKTLLLPMNWNQSLSLSPTSSESAAPTRHCLLFRSFFHSLLLTFASFAFYLVSPQSFLWSFWAIISVFPHVTLG